MRTTRYRVVSVLLPPEIGRYQLREKEKEGEEKGEPGDTTLLSRSRSVAHGLSVLHRENLRRSQGEEKDARASRGEDVSSPRTGRRNVCPRAPSLFHAGLVASLNAHLNRRSVGYSTAAFALAVLEGSTQHGVWFPEEICFGSSLNSFDRPPWLVETDPKEVGLGIYV
ncbi:hypothetical protein GW17_00002940 [Ensete ventricosum]|nr:hypothetical protein GW17_00002940 [Ensete ventricosum]RZS13021.1 hypothetical protein BHM03_00044573 [Ensete ventricosum]